MTDMERRRLQLYAHNIRLQNLRGSIERLEFVLGHLYAEVKEAEARALAPQPTSKKSAAKKLRRH